jgi:hypothetical protein
MARRSPSLEVKAFLRDLPPAAGKIAAALRRVVAANAPGAVESVVWGALSYHRPWIGGRVRGAVWQIVIRRGVVRLDLIHGVQLADPGGRLQGDGVSKRFVPVASAAAARHPDLARLIRAAARYAPGN